MNFTARFLFISALIFLNACTLGRNGERGDSTAPPAPGSSDSGQYLGTGTSAGNPLNATVAYQIAETLCDKNAACGNPLGLVGSDCIPTALSVRDEITNELSVPLVTLEATGNAELKGRLTPQASAADSCLLEIQTTSCDALQGGYAVEGPFDPRQYAEPVFTWRNFFSQTTACDQIYPRSLRAQEGPTI